MFPANRKMDHRMCIYNVSKTDCQYKTYSQIWKYLDYRSYVFNVLVVRYIVHLPYTGGAKLADHGPDPDLSLI